MKKERMKVNRFKGSERECEEKEGKNEWMNGDIKIVCKRKLEKSI